MVVKSFFAVGRDDRKQEGLAFSYSDLYCCIATLQATATLILPFWGYSIPGIPREEAAILTLYLKRLALP